MKTGKTILVKYAYVFEKLFIKDEGMVNAEGVVLKEKLAVFFLNFIYFTLSVYLSY